MGLNALAGRSEPTVAPPEQKAIENTAQTPVPPGDQVTVENSQATGTEPVSFVEQSAEPSENKPQGEDHRPALGAIVGGSLLANQGKRYMTGRVSLYHGTTAAVAQQVRQNGLLPANKAGTFGIIQGKNLPTQWADKAYVAHSKFKAGIYGLQSWGIRPGEGGARIVSMSVPEWGARQLALEVNPETAGGYRAWQNRMLGNIQGKYDKAVAAGNQQLARQLSSEMKHIRTGGWSPYLNQIYGGERAVSKVPTQYIKGSSDYVGLTVREVAEYAAKKPLRFSAGTLAFTAGVAAVGWGTYQFFDGE